LSLMPSAITRRTKENKKQHIMEDTKTVKWTKASVWCSPPSRHDSRVTTPKCAHARPMKSRPLSGFPPEAEKAAREQGVCCAPAATVLVEDLDAEDDTVRAQARALTYQAFK